MGERRQICTVTSVTLLSCLNDYFRKSVRVRPFSYFGIESPIYVTHKNHKVFTISISGEKIFRINTKK